MKKVIMFSALLLGLVFIFINNSFGQQSVPGVSLVINEHPVDVMVKTKKSGEFHIMYSQGYVIITNKEVFTKIRNHIPEAANSGKIVYITGYQVDIDKVFTRKQIKLASKQAGRDLENTPACLINSFALADGNGSKPTNW